MCYEDLFWIWINVDVMIDYDALNLNNSVHDCPYVMYK